MGILRYFGDARPARRFVLSVEPRVALGLAADYLKALGFDEHQWDLDSALGSGVVEPGWTGLLMGKGSNVKGVAAGCLFEVLPFFLLFSRFRRIHEPLRVVIYARPDSDPRYTELILFYPNDDENAADTWNQKDYLINAFESFAQVAYQAHAYVSGPECPDQKELTNEHPASYVGWIKLRKVMRREARRKRGWGF